MNDDVQRLLTGVVGDKGADAKGDLGLLPEVVIELLGVVKIQTVGEEQYLGPGVYAVLLEGPW